MGAFGDAMANLKRLELDKVIRELNEKQTPFLGICLGLQLLFECSEESPDVEGLGLLKGKISRIPDKEGLKIPHIGWNSLDIHNRRKTYLQGWTEQSICIFCTFLLSESRGILEYCGRQQPGLQYLISMLPWNRAICLPASSIRKRAVNGGTYRF